MVTLEIREFETYDDFAREWHRETLDTQAVSLEQARAQDLIAEDETRLRWQLLGQLDADELLIELPEWLADQNVGFVEGAVPTEFVGQIDRETEKAILFTESAAARSLLKLAHRLHQLDASLDTVDEKTDADGERREWLTNRQQTLQERFASRDDVTPLTDEWLPKSQLRRSVRRKQSE